VSLKPSDLDLVDSADIDPDAVGMSEEDVIPEEEIETEPFVPEPGATADLSQATEPAPVADAGPDPIEERRFKNAERAVSEITESRVNMFIGRLTAPGQLGKQHNWLTERRHLIAGDAIKLLKAPGYLKEHWEWIKFLSGSNLGTGDGEVAILMGMAVYQSLFEEFGKNLKA
jgi:hypothetical protein